MRDLKALCEQGAKTELEGGHLLLNEADELVKVIHNKGEYDAIIAAYCVGVAMGYNQGKAEATKGI